MEEANDGMIVDTTFVVGIKKYQHFCQKKLNICLWFFFLVVVIIQLTPMTINCCICCRKNQMVYVLFILHIRDAVHSS